MKYSVRFNLARKIWEYSVNFFQFQSNIWKETVYDPEHVEKNKQVEGGDSQDG